MRSKLVAAAVLSIVACRHRVDDVDPEVATAARSFLYCPQGKLEANTVAFERGDSRRDQYGWAEYEVVGCGRVTWCGTPESRLVCRAPHDLDLALQQLSVESGCPRTQIAQVEYFALNTQHTYRLAGCGQTYSCIVPMAEHEGNNNEEASSRFGSMLTCKAIATAPAPSAGTAAPPPPPPPPAP